jgi:hypothetical protein
MSEEREPISTDPALSHPVTLPAGTRLIPADRHALGEAIMHAFIEYGPGAWDAIADYVITVLGGQPAPLSEGAQEAVSWLFSADAAPLTARQAQHYIRERWGEAVEEELRDFGARPTS